MFGAVVAALVLRFTRSRAWALGLLIGTAAHVVTDVNDTAGTMLFFPFSTVTVTTGMWKHAAYLGRYGDAAAYYSSPGGLWDTAWLVVVLVAARRTLRAEYFHTVVVPADPKSGPGSTGVSGCRSGPCWRSTEACCSTRRAASWPGPSTPGSWRGRHGTPPGAGPTTCAGSTSPPARGGRRR